MVLAYHCIFGAYGFWLPNEPRGSGSDYIAVWDLFRYGPATKVQGRTRTETTREDHAWKVQAQESLSWPPVQMTGRQALAVATGFATAAQQANYAIHACAVLPDHVHLVIGRHERKIRAAVGHVKAKATRELRTSGLWPNDDRPLWGAHGWNVYLNTEDGVERAIRYVEENPVKEGKKRQNWWFVVPFNPAEARLVSRTVEHERRIGGAALRSMEEKARRVAERARRKRRGEMD